MRTASGSVRERPDVIKRARQHQSAMARNHAVRRLDAVTRRRRRRADHRAVGLRADRQRHHAGIVTRLQNRTMNRRACVEIVRVAGCAGMKIGKFGRHRLADNHRAGGAQPRHRRAIAHRLATLEQRRAVFGLVIGGVEMSLMATGTPCSAPSVLPFRGAHRAPWPAQNILAVDMDEGVHVASIRQCDRGRPDDWAELSSALGMRSAASIAVSAVKSSSATINSRIACWAATAQCRGTHRLASS